MKKRKKNNSKQIIGIAIIVIIVLIVGLVAFLNYNNKKENINKVNKYLYESLSCASDCLVTIGIEKPIKVSFDKACLDSCTGNATIIVPDINEVGLKITSKDTEKLLISSEEFLGCKNQFNSDQNADSYKACLIEILPGLKEKYDIN